MRRLPENYCPICGIYLPRANKDAGVYFNHECSQKSLNAITAANTRAENGTQNTDFHRTFDQRLKEGSELVSSLDNE
tara:strand:- start:794 stop:1024 length:231 start_codon:yes stop_codon:yes gene_type:complete